MCPVVFVLVLSLTFYDSLPHMRTGNTGGLYSFILVSIDILLDFHMFHQCCYCLVYLEISIYDNPCT